MASWAASFEKGNVEDLRKQLSILLRDAGQVLSYKESAGQYICEKYSWDEVAESTVSVYEECGR